jgi:PKD repeat protein
MKPVHLALLAALVFSLKSCYPEPVANFDYSYTDNTAPASVTFSNYSTDAEEYLWDFGDGNTSTTHSPTHIYEDGGNFSITLKATGRGGESSISKSITIVDPTSFIVKNQSSATLYGLATFYYEAATSTIHEDTWIDHGDIYPQEQTDETIQDVPSIDVAFQLINGHYYWVLQTFQLSQNDLTNIIINDYTQLIDITPDSNTANFFEDLKSLQKDGEVIILKDLID